METNHSLMPCSSSLGMTFLAHSEASSLHVVASQSRASDAQNLSDHSNKHDTEHFEVAGRTGRRVSQRTWQTPSPSGPSR